MHVVNINVTDENKKELDWEAFDEKELAQIELGVDLLTDFVETRKNDHIDPNYIMTMFLEDFDGFEETTPEMAIAITERLKEKRARIAPKVEEDPMAALDGIFARATAF